ncbi:MAG: hypothetical protein MZW92_42125 [Comamonadaceae bacterium]|nr:hypothetical protein [Comamonadaceae bacterium]
MPRVLRRPGARRAAARAFAADGLELTVGFWIADPRERHRATCARRRQPGAAAHAERRGRRDPVSAARRAPRRAGDRRRGPRGAAAAGDLEAPPRAERPPVA